MKYSHIFTLLIALIITFFCINISNAKIKGKITSPHKIIEVSSKNVLKAVKKHRDSFEDSPEVLNNALTQLLKPVVDFDAISYAVMGKYRKTATLEQKKRFSKVFERTLIKLYTKVLIAFDAKSIVIEPPKKTLKPTAKKAKVTAKVTASDKTVYYITYTMRKNKQKNWVVRNMIVDGINLGLTYLNQFDSAMNQHNKNIDDVITEWSKDTVK